MRYQNRNHIMEWLITYGVLIGASIFALFPILWVLSTSLKERSSIFTFPPQWIPSPVTLESYKQVLSSNMPLYFRNHILVALSTILVTLSVASLAGYAAARFRFRGKDSLLLLLLSSSMIPGVAALIPLYTIASSVGLIDTLYVLVVIYSAWQIPTVMWLMKGFFETIPKALEEAAMIDGCSRFQVFYKIVVMLSQPGLAAAAIWVFVYVWNEFIIALTLTTSDSRRIVTVGLYHYVTAFGVEWGKLTAAVMIALVPVIVLFIILQRRFIQGLTSGAIKA